MAARLIVICVATATAAAVAAAAAAAASAFLLLFIAPPGVGAFASRCAFDAASIVLEARRLPVRNLVFIVVLVCSRR